METKLILRFNEIADETRPADELGNLAELEAPAGADMPAVVDAALGRGREFTGGEALAAADVDAGSTLLTRDASIQVVLRWDLAAQHDAGEPGTIYARGDGSAAAQYVGAGLELRVVNQALNVGELRWIWQDVAGALKTQIGGHFQPSATEFQLLTATRRWASSGEVVLRYYLGELLLAEVISADGSIGGGTTGITAIGARQVGGAYDNFLCGVIDELRVVDYELTAEEIALTWKRLTVYQPAGYQLVRELHDPGFPISQDPGSRAQRETRLWGHALGFAIAQAENLRNLLPSRAYGEVLEEWETITRQPRKPGDSVETRRARVVAKERHLDGFSIPGVKRVLDELVDTDVDNLEILAFDQTVRDPFDTLEALRWGNLPGSSDSDANWAINAGMLRMTDPGGDPGDFTGATRDWSTRAMSIGGDGKGASVLVKLVPTTFPTTAAPPEAGVFLGDLVNGNLILLGVKLAGINYFAISELFVGWVSQGVTIHGGLGAAPAAVWLHLRHLETARGSFDEGNAEETFRLAWSTTSQTAGYASADVVAPRRHQWAGLYTRAVGGGFDDPMIADFDDAIVRAPYGERSFFAYVYRDPALPGRPDRVGANHVLRELKQAHAHAALITSKQVICDDPTTPCDGGPLGGI